MTNATATQGYAYSETDEKGTVSYYNEAGDLHRTDGPALEKANGTMKWRFNGKLHRTDGPAIERADGNKEFFLNGCYFDEDEFSAEVARRKAEGAL